MPQASQLSAAFAPSENQPIFTNLTLSNYVGHANARIRDQLWQKACDKIKDGSVLQIWNTANEQGFTMRSWNEPTYRVREFEGVLLVEHPAEEDSILTDVAMPDGQKSLRSPRGGPALDGPMPAQPPHMTGKA